MPILYNSENEWTISIQFNMDDVQNMGGGITKEQAHINSSKKTKLRNLLFRDIYIWGETMKKSKEMINQN